MDKRLYQKLKIRYKKRSVAIAIAGFFIGCLLGYCGGEVLFADTLTVDANAPDVIVEHPVIECSIVEPSVVSLGVCKVTAYCVENYPHICNDGDSSRTATGTKPTPGRTIAVDPKVIPYGSEVIINGHTYIAEDCGGAIKGNKIDIVFATHREALDFGIQYAEVSYVIKEAI